jgi:Fe-S cluster biogenesis protein NfuA
VTDLAAEVTAALERSVLPSVIARGAAVRVAAATGGIVTLEVTGSPGAVFPLAARIEALIRAAVPQITAVRLVTPGGGPSGSGPPGGGPAGSGPDTGGGLAEAARRVLDAEVNPAIAAHRGHVAVEGADQGWVRLRLEGGCQGCSLAEVTLRQGIEPLLRARLPAMTGLIDITDHEAGTDPFFSPEKR